MIGLWYPASARLRGQCWLERFYVSEAVIYRLRRLAPDPTGVVFLASDCVRNWIPFTPQW